MRIQNRHRSLYSSRRGLTLIEILLAVSILSIISLSVFNVLRAGLQLEKRGQGKSDFYHEIKSALDLMTEDIENAEVYDFSNSYPDRAAFEGGSNKVKFIKPDGNQLKVISYYLDWPQQGEIHTTIIGKTTTKNVTVNIQSQSRNEVYDLIREEKSLIDDLSQGNEADSLREVIAERIPPGGLIFSYGYLPQAGDGSGIVWKDQWALNKLPRRVRIEMKFSNIDQSREIPVTKDVIIPQGMDAISENESIQ